MIRALLHSPNHRFSADLDPRDVSELLKEKRTLLWLDVVQPAPEELELLQREFGFHELAIEDVARPHQRPKLEEYDNFYLLVFYSLSLAEADGSLQSREIDLLAGENYLVTIHADALPEIDEAMGRWRRNDETIGHGIGTLFYSLLDSLVDAYFEVSDGLAEEVADLEERIFRVDTETVAAVFALKKRLLSLRRILGPERDAVNVLMRQDIPLLDRRTVVYLRDVYDHLVRVTDTIDLHNDLLTSALDAHLSNISNRLNQVMKTLTVITTILMSAALIAGIYGMNFRNMPELEWQFGYPWALGLMVAVGLALYAVFRRKRWL